jgi:ferritin-like metal-binding protein YciE
MESNTINTIHNLIDFQISQFLSAEVELKNVLPKWITGANSLQLKTVLQKYIEFINQHIKAIEDFITEEQIAMVPSNDPIMLAFIRQTDECLSYCKNAEIKDACLLASIQGINHYKISIYGTTSTFADLLELRKFATILHEADINEKHIDDRLTQLAKYEINNKAKSPIAI